MARLREIEARFPGEEIPRPPHWSGFRIIPNEIEFWAEGDYRLHDRRLYKRRPDGGWDQEVLSP
jgi:pyridoxamine 5'-phosphate oxidase